MLSRSGRFHVISSVRTVSSAGNSSVRGVPAATSRSTRKIPSWASDRPSSSAAHSIPSETSPLILLRLILVPSGSVAPRGANAALSPMLKLLAPQTTFTCSEPLLTLHRRRRSALGCCPISTISPTTRSVNPPPEREMLSTSVPEAVNASASSSAVASKSTNSFSQLSGTFMTKRSASPQAN